MQERFFLHHARHPYFHLEFHSRLTSDLPDNLNGILTMAVSSSELATLRGNLVAEYDDCIYVEEASGDRLVHRVAKEGMHELARREVGRDIEITFVVTLLDVMMTGMNRLVI